PAGIKGFGHGARLRDPAMARYVRSRFRSSPRTGPRSPIHNYCQYLLGAAVRTVPPCVQGECYPRISPYPLELLPDAYRAVHHGERAPRAVADAEVHHRGEQDASRRRHVGEQDDTVTLEDFVDGV